MTAFIELVAVELAVTLSVGAVLGFASALSSTPEQSKRRDRPQGCRAAARLGLLGLGRVEARAGKAHQHRRIQ